MPNIAYLVLSSLKSHPDGVRSVSQEELYKLKKSIMTFGLLRPLTMNTKTGFIIDGDRVLAALNDINDYRTGVRTVPVWCVEIPEEMEDIAHLALNNHVGEWQWEPVAGLLKTIQERKQPIELTGFHDSDIGPLTTAEWKPAEKGPLDGSDPNQSTLFKL